MLLGLSCLLGCTNNANKITPEMQRAYRLQVLSQFSNQQTGYSDRNLQFANRLVNEMAQRLLHDSPNVSVTVDVIKSDQVISFSYPAGIVISSGLIKHLPAEAMTAFVIAHELAHHMLGHTDLLNKKEDQNEAQQIACMRYNLRYEMAADRLAVALLASAAYDVRQATQALTVVTSALHGLSSNSNNSDIIERQAAMREFIDHSRWQPPGTITRREYQEMRAGL